jgi:hypothetical protein
MNRPVTINASAIPVAGIGGFGMLAIAGLMAEEFPLVRLVCLWGGVGGIVAGIALIIFRRHGSFEF